MDPQIALEGQPHQRLSRLIANTQTRRRFLGQYWGRDDAVFCLCRRHAPVAMGVARRRAPDEIFYLYPLHQGDGALHLPECPHFLEHDRDRLTRPAGESASDGALIDVPLRHDMRRPGRALGHAPEPSALLPLLETLWDTAELNTWHPGFQGKRHYGVVQHRIMQSAADVTVNAKALGARFLMPPAYKPSRQSECDKALTEFIEALAPGEPEQAHEGFICGQLKDTQTDGKRGTIRLAHLALKLRVGAHDLAQYARRWQLNDDNTVILARVVVSRWRPRRKTKPRVLIHVRDMAALTLADFESWIPVDDPSKRALCAAMVEQQRSFKRVLPAGAESDGFEPGLSPDFLATDTDEDLPLEVLTAMCDRGYALRAGQRLVARRGASWWWDTRWPMPELPRKGGDDD